MGCWSQMYSSLGFTYSSYCQWGSLRGCRSWGQTLVIGWDAMEASYIPLQTISNARFAHLRDVMDHLRMCDGASPLQEQKHKGLGTNVVIIV